MDIKKELTQDEIAILEGFLEDGIEAHYNFYIEEAGMLHDEAIDKLRRLADYFVQLEHDNKILELMRTRPEKESPDFLIAKEDIKRYFARITGDAKAVEKCEKKGKRLKKQVEAEREVDVDVRGIRAATRLYCVEPIAQAFKHKLFLHWENTYTNVLTMNEAIYLADSTAPFLFKRKQFRQGKESIINKGIDAIDTNGGQALLTIFCARLIEAYIDSPHAYLYIRGTDEEGNVCNLFAEELRDFLAESGEHLTVEQRAIVENNARALYAVQGEEVAKACRKAAKKIDPARIRTCENFVGVYEDNEAKIIAALHDAIQAKGGLDG